MRLRVVVRLLTIQRALVRHGLDELIRATHLYSPFRFLFYLSPWTWFQRSAGDTRGERLRLDIASIGHGVETVTVRRVGTAADIAPAVVFLASPGASFITGTDIRVDGGVSNPSACASRSAGA